MSESDFDRIKNALDLLNVITGETGLSMKGKHLEACPFCDGHNCFNLWDGGMQFKCHQCNRTGDVFEFLQECHTIDKIEALNKAADLANIKLETKTAAPKAVNMSMKHRIFEAAMNIYKENLKTKGASEYLLKKRGHKEKTLQTLNIGWSTGNLYKTLKDQGYSDNDLIESGLIRNKDKEGNEVKPYDLFQGGLAVFPHFVNGNIGHFTQKDAKKEAKHQLPITARDAAWSFYNQRALSGKEIILVEGEHDLASLLDAGVQNVIALIGNISDKQLKELEKKTVGKRLYLWVDKDEQGGAYIRKITGKLKGENFDIRIIEHPGGTKDADEYIKAIEGDPRKEVKGLIEAAAPYLDWEIERISKLSTQDEKLKQLKAHNIFSQVSFMVEIQKEVYIEKLMRISFSRKAIEQQLDNNQELLEKIAQYEELVKEKERSPLRYARMIFEYFNQFGRFFKDPQDITYLLYKHKIYHISDNVPFNALMQKHTRMIQNKSPGPQVWKSLQSYAYNDGLSIDLASWIHVNRADSSIYINLNAPGNGILKMSPGSIEEIENGLNHEGVLLNSSNKIMPFTYLPDVNVREGMELVRDLLLKNLTCEEEQRHLILCWLITAFMIDFAPHMALMKFSGASSSGKTTGAKLLSLILYGNEQIIDPSGAAAFTVASQNPLLIIDNLEQEDITKQIAKFLLLSSTKGSKEKRKAGTETETTQETPKSLVLITAIEPFTKAEHINRTYDIHFSHKYHTDGFIEDEVIGEIVKHRDKMLSAILKIIANDILPNLKDRKDNLIILKKEYSKHSKTRTNEYLALMMLILTKTLPHTTEDGDAIADEEQTSYIWGKWLEYQDLQAKETETGANMIVKLLNGITRGFLVQMKKQSNPDAYQDVGFNRDTELINKHISDEEERIKSVKHYEDPDLGLTAYLSEEKKVRDEEEGSYSQWDLFIVATAADMVFALDTHCKEKTLKNPFTNASTFAARLRNDIKVLGASGWSLMSKPGIEPHIRIVRGDRYYLFRKRVIR